MFAGVGAGPPPGAPGVASSKLTLSRTVHDSPNVAENKMPDAALTRTASAQPLTGRAHEISIAPDDPALVYGGGVSLAIDAKRARATRQFGTADLSRFGFAVSQAAGTRVRWRSLAEYVRVRLRYRRACNRSCAIDLDHRSCYLGGRCEAQCEPKLLVDGTTMPSLHGSAVYPAKAFSLTAMDQAHPADHE